MHVAQLAILAALASQSNDSAKVDSAKYPDSLYPADTLPAVELKTTPFYIRDTCGEARVWLDSAYTCLHDLLTTALQKKWKGQFTFDQLVKKYSRIEEFPQFRPALFMLDGRRGAVYVSYLENPGFVPTIALVNDKDEQRLKYRYATAIGVTTAWAAPIPVK